MKVLQTMLAIIFWQFNVFSLKLYWSQVNWDLILLMTSLSINVRLKILGNYWEMKSKS